MEEEGANEEMSDLWVHFFSHQLSAEVTIYAVMMHFNVLAQLKHTNDCLISKIGFGGSLIFYLIKFSSLPFHAPMWKA